MANKVVIPIGGMSNVPDVNVSRDGDMQLLVNMRHRGGDIVQVARPQETPIVGVKSIYKHAAADKVLGISDDGKVVYDIDLATGMKSALPMGELVRGATDEEARALAGESVIPEGGEVLATFDVEGFADSMLYDNGLLDLVPQVGYEGVIDFPQGAQPWQGYRKSIRYVRVGEGFTVIGLNAFSNCVNLAAVAIPDSVSKISGNAFAGCYALKSVFLPEGVEIIDDIAFAGCDVGDVYVVGYYDNLSTVFPGATLHVRYASLYGDDAEVMNVRIYQYEVDSLSFMGNIVCMRCADGMRYIRWKGDRYGYLGELPTTPDVRFDTELHVSKAVTREMYLNAWNEEMKYDALWAYAKGGYYDVALDQLYQDGDMVDSALYRVGLRLFDGSYIVSPIYYVVDNLSTHVEDDKYLNPGKGNFIDYGKTGAETDIFNVCVRGMRVNWLFFGYDYRDWQDIIVSVDIFSTGSIMHHVRTENAPIAEVSGASLHTVEGAHKGVFWSVLPDEDYVRNLVDAMAKMYRVASYDLVGEEKWRIKNSSPSNIAVQEMLANIISVHEYMPTIEMVYNARMHLGGVERRIFPGYDDYSVRQSVEGIYSGDSGWETIGEVVAVITLDGVEGETRVVKYIEEFRVMKRGEKMYISPLISYPDVRATKIELYFPDGKIASYALQRHDVLNMAYYLNVKKAIDEGGSEVLERATYSADDTMNVHWVDRPVGMVDAAKLKAKIYALVKDKIVGLVENGVIPEGVNEYEYTLSREVFNWFILRWNGGEVTVAKTIVLSEWGLEGINSNVVESHWNLEIKMRFKRSYAAKYDADIEEIDISQTDGVWEVLPSPVREVEALKNVLYVGEVDNPWYYPSTYKFEGNIVAVASSAEEVSSGQFGQYPLYVFTTEGIWVMGIDASGKGAYVTQTPVSREVCTGQVCPVTGGVVFSTGRGIMIIQGSQVTNLSAVLDGEADVSPVINNVAALAGMGSIVPIRFREYIKECVIAFNYLHNEVLVSNNGCSYSYVYSLTNNTWGVTNGVYGERVNSYPELMMYDSDKVYSFVDVVEPAPMMFFTRPVKLGITDNKRVLQAALRGTWEGKMFFYIFGSNDGVNWALLSGKEHKTEEKHRDLVAYVGRSRSYRYVAFAVASPGFNGRVAMLEMVVSDGIADNKLR